VFNLPIPREFHKGLILNKKLLRVLGQMEMGDEASLVCELPRHLLKDVSVDDYGQVDLAGLLTLCKHLSAGESLGFDTEGEEELDFSNFSQEEKDLEKGSFWFRMIYDRSLAVDPVGIR
jgi:hypothetical protein